MSSAKPSSVASGATRGRPGRRSRRPGMAKAPVTRMLRDGPLRRFIIDPAAVEDADDARTPAPPRRAQPAFAGRVRKCSVEFHDAGERPSQELTKLTQTLRIYGK